MPLTPQLISDYEYSRNRPQPGVSVGQVRRLLKAQPVPKKLPAKPPQEVSWLRLGITGEVSHRTAEVIAQQTDWDRRGWDWCTVESEDRVSIGDHVLIFDYSNGVGWAKIAVVRSITRTAVRTPNGCFFFAYLESRQRFRKRRISKTFWHGLAAAGLRLTKKESQSTRKLSKGAINATLQMFRR